MVKAKIVKDSEGYCSFTCLGHSGFARRGKDIVCSAISILTINTANSIMKFTSTVIETDETDGFISWTFVNGCDSDAVLLMDSLILGLESISNAYGNKYLTLEIEEV